MTAQEKPKVIPVDNFVRDELYPDYTQAFGTQPFAVGPVGPPSKADNASYSLHFSEGMVPPSTAPRKLGAVGWDMLPVYEVQRPLNDTESIWHYASEYCFPRACTDRRPKIGLPGPYGVTTELDFSPVYRNRRYCAEALAPAIRRDIQDLVAAGCDYIQIEEPLTPSRSRGPYRGKPGRSPQRGCRWRQRLHVRRAHLLWLVPPPAVPQPHLPLAFPSTARRQRARVQPAIRRPRDDRDRPGRKMGPGADSLRRADRHQNTLLRDTGGHYRARPHLPGYRDPEQLEISTDCGLPASLATWPLARCPPPPRPPAVCAQTADPL